MNAGRAVAGSVGCEQGPVGWGGELERSACAWVLGAGCVFAHDGTRACFWGCVNRTKTKEDAMNTIQLIGRLTADPECRALAEDKSVANMRLAVGRRDRKAAPVYVDVVAWGKLAELCAEHLEKGRQVAISGRLEYSEWEAQDGSKRSKHEVVAGEVEFLAKAKASGEEPATAAQGDS